MNRDIGNYIDELWGRIGVNLASRGVKSKDIQRVIREVRAQK
jgi:hypothetical protein